MDKDLLVYYIKKAEKTREELAKQLGIAKKTLDNKLCGQTEFTLAEIRKIVNILNLDANKIAEVFFADNVE